MAILNLIKRSETLADIPDKRKLTNSDLLIEQRTNFNRLIDALNSMNEQIEEIKAVKNQVIEHENKLTNLTEKVIPDLKRDLTHEINLVNAKLLERIETIERENLMVNAHSRRLHLIVNGIKPAEFQRGESEDTEAVFRDLLKNKLKLDHAYVDRMLFRDVHRLPKSNQHDGPPPIIAAFLCQEHRNRVLANAKELKGTRISLKPDLPKELNKLRGKFLNEMTRLRERGHEVRTVERGYMPVLQLKSPANGKWENILSFDKKQPLQLALNPVLRANLRE